MPPLIEVIRSTPPDLGRCRAPECKRAIEWVRTAITDKRMPVDHPLVVERVHVTATGTHITVIDRAHSHFATCPAADTFRNKGRR